MNKTEITVVVLLFALLLGWGFWQKTQLPPPTRPGELQSQAEPAPAVPEEVSEPAASAEPLPEPEPEPRPATVEPATQAQVNVSQEAGRLLPEKTTDLTTDKTQITFWIYMVILVAITLGGLHVLMHATETRAMLTGLFMALVGIINIALIKIWAHIRLVMFYIIWDSQNRLEAELNKSLAEDL